ncbi:hypothetical protein ACWGJX_43885 [Streptomyces sp. NPDC054775]
MASLHHGDVQAISGERFLQFLARVYSSLCCEIRHDPGEFDFVVAFDFDDTLRVTRIIASDGRATVLLRVIPVVDAHGLTQNGIGNTEAGAAAGEAWVAGLVGGEVVGELACAVVVVGVLEEVMGDDEEVLGGGVEVGEVGDRDEAAVDVECGPVLCGHHVVSGEECRAEGAGHRGRVPGIVGGVACAGGGGLGGVG